MKLYIIYLLTRVFHDFHHPRTDRTSADEIFVDCDEKAKYESDLEDKAENVSIEVLHQFECEPREVDAYLMSWYAKWDHPQKEDARQRLFDDDPNIEAHYEPIQEP